MLAAGGCPRASDRGERLEGLGRHYLSKATLSNAASFVLCFVSRVKDHYKLLHSSPCLKKSYVRQVVLDEWFPVEGR